MTEASAVPYSLLSDAVPDATARAVVDGAVAAEADVALIDVSGPGIVDCLQGILTNDVEAAGPGGFFYAAVLTNKGAVVCDMWTARATGLAWLTVPAQGKQTALEAFARYLPPRLARATDRTDEIAVLRVAGPEALGTARRAGIAIPETGTCVDAVVGEAACNISRPPEPADFALQIQVDRERAGTVLRSLGDAGAVIGGPESLEVARILAGWPRLGAEIDDKTLPQEVRFDDLNGVSYTKGCYVGQETVARLHFRGHTNRELRGVRWNETPDATVPDILHEGESAGRVTSIAWLAPFDLHVGLGMVRSRVDLGSAVTAGGVSAEIVGLPIDLTS